MAPPPPIIPPDILQALRVLVAAANAVPEDNVSVTASLRMSDKTGLEEVAVDVRVNGELLSGAQEALVQDVLNAAREAAQVVHDARAEGVTLTLAGKGRRR